IFSAAKSLAISRSICNSSLKPNSIVLPPLKMIDISLMNSQAILAPVIPAKAGIRKSNLQKHMLYLF
ncbi:MAG: hypothetical protein K8R45_13225, partial [Desulfobacterales bacterium]|nr:hypothetical protein [Desulfobacterales bacterium]